MTGKSMRVGFLLESARAAGHRLTAAGLADQRRCPVNNMIDTDAVASDK